MSLYVVCLARDLIVQRVNNVQEPEQAVRKRRKPRACKHGLEAKTLKLNSRQRSLAYKLA